jgi:hypothetical protein
MANIDWPAGLRPVRNGKAGTAPRITKYTRSTTGALYEGAPCYLASTGPAVAAQTTMDPAVLGAVAAYVGASDTEVFVYDDPDQEYEIQGDSAVTTPIAIIGQYCNPLNPTTGNATTLQSKCELDTSEATSVQGDGDIFQIVRLVDEESNDQDVANAKWIVKISEASHVFTSGGTISA